MATGQTAFPLCSVFTSHYFTAENQGELCTHEVISVELPQLNHNPSIKLLFHF